MKFPSPQRMVQTGASAARIVAVTLAVHLAAPPAQAQNTAINNNSRVGSIGTASNWSPTTVPTVVNDAVFTGTPDTGIRSFNTGTLTFGSLDVTAASGTYSIRNQNTSEAASTLILGGPGNLGNGLSGADANDLIYVTSGATLNLTATGGTNGIGVFGINLGQSGNFNIAGSSAISCIIADGGHYYAMTKTGAGSLTLSGANTYTGNTTVSGGTLVLADTGGLTFVVTDATSNRLAGGGAATLNGVFTIDTSAVTATAACGSWQLVDAASLNETYGSTFAVAGGAWLEHSNIWEKTEGGRTWTFTEGSGVLALTSPGGTAYETWATTGHVMSVTHAAFDFDYDNDGLANGLEWILGGDPGRNDTPAVLPHCTGGVANGLTLVFSRESTSLAESALVVEWGIGPGMLANRIIIGDSDVEANDIQPTVDIDAPEEGKVTVNIPPANANGGKLFARLRATRN